MPQRSLEARVYLTFIGILIAGAGAIFTHLMWKSFSRAREIDSWPQVPAVVLQADIEERQIDPNRPTEFRFSLLYAYEFGGGGHQSDRLRLRGSAWTARRGDVEALIDRYPPGTSVTAFVNPADPGLAVLEGESRAPGYSIWFPLIFVVGGLGVIAGAWRPEKEG